MIKHKLILAILAGFVILAGGSYPAYADLVHSRDGRVEIIEEGVFKVNLPVPEMPLKEVSFELATELEDVQRVAMVYQVKGPNVTEAMVKEIGERLGFSGEATLDPSGSRFSMLDERNGSVREFAVTVNSGALEYSSTLGIEGLFPATPPELPSDQEAGAIATDFLSQAGLLPADTHFSEVLEGGW
ncbi:hypothetical protein ACFLXE_06505 [Chloroflexota bacterium]